MQVDTDVTVLEESAPVAGTAKPLGRPRRSDPSRFTLERVLRFLLGVGVGVLAAFVLWYFARLVIYLIVGIVLAYLLKPLVDRAQGFGLGRIPAILCSFVLVFGAMSLLLTFIAPFVAVQVRELSQQISPRAVAGIAGWIEDMLGRFIPLQEGVIIEGIVRGFRALFQEEQLSSTFSTMVDLFTDLFYAVLVIPCVTFFVLKDGLQLRHSVLRLVPNRYFEITLAIVEKIEVNIGRYFRGLLLQSASVGAVACLLLSLVGLDYAIAVGIFTGLANTIPYFGPLMGFVAGTLVGVSQTGDFALVPAIFIAMGLTQVADNVLFQPLIFSRAAQAHPLVILFVVLIGAQVAGIIGMLIAIPVTATLRVTAEQVLWSLRNYRILKAI